MPITISLATSDVINFDVVVARLEGSPSLSRRLSTFTWTEGPAGRYPPRQHLAVLEIEFPRGDVEQAHLEALGLYLSAREALGLARDDIGSWPRERPGRVGSD